MTNGSATGAPAYLVYELERRAYPVIDGCAIGRDTSNDVVVAEPTVSRAHARVTREGDAYKLETTGATGARVNGTPVAGPQTLSFGDRVEIGSAVLTLRRPPLPLGVSIVDRVRAAETLDPIGAKRATIRNPLLSPAPAEPAKKRDYTRWIVLGVLLLALAAVLLR